MQYMQLTTPHRAQLHPLHDPVYMYMLHVMEEVEVCGGTNSNSAIMLVPCVLQGKDMYSSFRCVSWYSSLYRAHFMAECSNRNVRHVSFIAIDFVDHAPNRWYVCEIGRAHV